MFGMFDDVINAAIDVITDVFSLEAPKRADIVRLADAGLTIAVIASAVGVTESVVRQVLADK
jgi:hypothetical protein